MDRGPVPQAQGVARLPPPARSSKQGLGAGPGRGRDWQQAVLCLVPSEPVASGHLFLWNRFGSSVSSCPGAFAGLCNARRGGPSQSSPSQDRRGFWRRPWRSWPQDPRSLRPCTRVFLPRGLLPWFFVGIAVGQARCGQAEKSRLGPGRDGGGFLAGGSPRAGDRGCELLRGLPRVDEGAQAEHSSASSARFSLSWSEGCPRHIGVCGLQSCSHRGERGFFAPVGSGP